MNRTVQIIQVIVVVACWVAGVILRFQPMPASAAGGGLILLGIVLLAYWYQRSRYPKR